MGPYLDTSALAKWYLNEPFADKFEAFIQKRSSAAISSLSVLEFRCLLARRRRAGEVGKSVESRVFAAFESDIRAGFLELYPVSDDHLTAAPELITRLGRLPLRTLDALHLAIVQAISARTLATADRTMAEAGKGLGLNVVRFF